MVEKRTDREQIQTYANQGVEIFQEIAVQLQSLTERVANVNYRGANARAFKTQCATDAVEFAGAITQTMGSMFDVVEGATSFIATALGGQQITLGERPNVTVAMPVISADESVEAAEDTALHQLRQDTDSIYTEIVSKFQENLSNLDTLGVDGWWGPEYDDARNAMGSLTNTAIDRCEQSRANMTSNIQTQIDILFT